LAFTVGLGQQPRLKTITALSILAVLGQIKAANKRFGLPDDAAVLCCYEAGRDGFWLHRFLLAHRVQNRVVDSSSIKVNRRQRRAKSTIGIERRASDRNSAGHGGKYDGMSVDGDPMQDGKPDR
jgi:hypothetical protein